MGACCTGKEHKSESRHEELNMRNLRQSYNNSLEYNSNLPEIDLEVDKSDYARAVCSFVKKYSKNDDKLLNPIKLFSIEHLWNITKYHNDDYSTSDYLLLDIRESTKRKENFLKKYKMINYNLQQMKMLSGSSLDKFKRFINSKSIIIVGDNAALETLDELITFILDLNAKATLCLLDNDLETGLSFKNKYLLSILEDKAFQTFPYIFLALKYFPRFASDRVIFLNIVGTNNDFTTSLNVKANESLITSIRQFYQIETVVNISDNSLADLKKEKDVNYLSCVIKSKDDLIIQKDTLIKLADNIKDYLKLRTSCLFNIHINIAKSEYFVFLMFFFASKILNINLKKLRPYAYDNFLFIQNVKLHCANNFNKYYSH
jgi:hypothetical protein